MKKSVPFLLACLVSAWGAQSSASAGVLKDFVAKAAVSRVAFGYTYAMKSSNGKVQGAGSVVMQGNAFRMKGDGLEMWCDGKTLWTVDRASREVVISPVDDSGDGFAANPALLVVSVDKAFDEVDSATGKFKDSPARVSVLKPKERLDAVPAETEITQLKLYFAGSGLHLIGVEITVEDGSVTVFDIAGMKFDEKSESADEFRFDERSLDSSYVVTDLR